MDDNQYNFHVTGGV